MLIKIVALLIMNLSIRCIDYNEHSIAVYGNTKPFKDQLLQLGGKYNNKLNIEGVSQPGWIFRTNSKPDVVKFISDASNSLVKLDDITIEKAEAGNISFQWQWH